MDKISTPNSGTGISRHAWKDSIPTLIELKKIPGLVKVQIRLPYGVTVINDVSPIINFNYTDIEDTLVINYPMLLEHSYYKDRPVLKLVQKFPAKCFDQSFTKQPGFLYKIAEEYTIITRIIGTIDSEIIKQQVKLLLQECNRFHLLYC